MPAQIFFGAGSLDNLGSAPLPGTKALIVTVARPSNASDIWTACRLF